MEKTLKEQLLRKGKQILVIILITPWSVFGALALMTCSSIGTKEPVPRPQFERAEVEKPELERPQFRCPVGTNEVIVNALSESGEITNTSVTCALEIVRPLYR